MARIIIMWVIMICAKAVEAQDTQIEKGHVMPGEELIFSMNYGWFIIGKAEIFFDEEIWYVNDRPHYYLQGKVYTTGVFGFFASMDICLESWIEVASLRPKRSNRQIFFGQKMDIRMDKYDYDDSLTISSYIEDVDRYRTHKINLSDTLTLDLLSTYINLRNIVFHHNASDTTWVKTHFSNSIYPFGIIRSGSADEDLVKFDLIFPESGQYKKGNKAYLLASKEEVIIPKEVIIELTLGKLVFVLEDRIQY